MAFDPSRLKKETDTSPMRMVVYGPKGVGKTTFAASFPKPFFIRTEDGLGELSVVSAGILNTWSDLVDQLTWLHDGDHDFKTVCLDSLDWLEPIIHAEACKRNKWPNIEHPGYGKGYAAAVEIWREYIGYLNGLRRDRGMFTVQIAHTKVKDVHSPGMEPYAQFKLKLNDRASEVITEDIDVVGFLSRLITTTSSTTKSGKTYTKAVGSNQVILKTGFDPSIDVKVRYSGFPGEVIITPDGGYSDIEQYLPHHKGATNV